MTRSATIVAIAILTLAQVAFAQPQSKLSSSLDGQNAGAERNDNGLKLALLWCPPGKFTMGSPASDPAHLEDEVQKPVTLSRGFWLGKTEVTQGQWQDVMGTRPWDGKEGVQAGDGYPAACVNWEQTMEFGRKLTQQERAAKRLPADWGYTLPTEAQWEYACRAGTTTRYSFGSDDAMLEKYAWSFENTEGVGEKFAHFVGQKRPNPWGFFDIHGNVEEWCRDWYAETLAGGTDPEATAKGVWRIARSGSWGTEGKGCRSAVRHFNPPESANRWLGFRIALIRIRK